MKDILQQLQSRIDTNSNSISECWPSDFNKESWKYIHEQQALDKRLYGEIVRLRKDNKFIYKRWVAAVKKNQQLANGLQLVWEQ